VFAGPALHVRELEITRFRGDFPATFCDPWLGFCHTAETPVHDVVGRRSTTDFGLLAGAGLRFRLSGDTRLFLESRWQRVWGDEPDVAGGRRSADANYLPLVLGVEF
jgi:hypothetical protein